MDLEPNLHKTLSQTPNKAKPTINGGGFAFLEAWSRFGAKMHRQKRLRTNKACWHLVCLASRILPFTIFTVQEPCPCSSNGQISTLRYSQRNYWFHDFMMFHFVSWFTRVAWTHLGVDFGVAIFDSPKLVGALISWWSHPSPHLPKS